MLWKQTKYNAYKARSENKHNTEIERPGRELNNAYLRNKHITCQYVTHNKEMA